MFSARTKPSIVFDYLLFHYSFVCFISYLCVYTVQRILLYGFYSIIYIFFVCLHIIKQIFYKLSKRREIKCGNIGPPPSGGCNKYMYLIPIIYIFILNCHWNVLDKSLYAIRRKCYFDIHTNVGTANRSNKSASVIYIKKNVSKKKHKTGP